jgi:hypothetical protein
MTQKLRIKEKLFPSNPSNLLSFLQIFRLIVFVSPFLAGSIIFPKKGLAFSVQFSEPVYTSIRKDEIFPYNVPKLGFEQVFSGQFDSEINQFSKSNIYNSCIKRVDFYNDSVLTQTNSNWYTKQKQVYIGAFTNFESNRINNKKQIGNNWYTVVSQNCKKNNVINGNKVQTYSKAHIRKSLNLYPNWDRRNITRSYPVKHNSVYTFKLCFTPTIFLNELPIKLDFSYSSNGIFYHTSLKVFLPQIIPPFINQVLAEKFHEKTFLVLKTNNEFSYLNLLNSNNLKFIASNFIKVFLYQNSKNVLRYTTKIINSSFFENSHLKKCTQEKDHKTNDNCVLTLKCFFSPLKGDFIICTKENIFNVPIGTVGYITKVLNFSSAECKFNTKHFISYTSKQKEILLKSVSGVQGTGLIISDIFLSNMNFSTSLVFEN